ncbi:unnamed protein product [Somion occarium]|uniref:Secreted protein n=1 Tax=Somion occarium TaxID=3059160 RepID=A0ABP1E5G3_9APHY
MLLKYRYLLLSSLWIWVSENMTPYHLSKSHRTFCIYASSTSKPRYKVNMRIENAIIAVNCRLKLPTEDPPSLGGKVSIVFHFLACS